jgi:hypothetical protein
MTSLRALSLVAVVALCLGARCGASDAACVDLRGRTVELRLSDPTACFTSSVSACRELTLPDRLVVRVVDELVQRRDLRCDTYRAEVVTGDFGDLQLLGPADATLEISGASFAVSESVRVGSSDCFGRLFVAAGPLGEGSSRPEDWLVMEPGHPRWSAAFRFVPSDTASCTGILNECTSANCFADVLPSE